MKRNIFIVVVVVITAVLIRFIISFASTKLHNNMLRNMSAPLVSVSDVTETSVIKSFEEPGRVISKYRVDVLARISGYLQKSYFKEGDEVKEGQILFLIEPTQYTNASNVAAANVKNLQAQLIFAEKQLTRASELVKKDYIAKAQYDQILSERDSIKAQLASAQSQYNDANRNLGYTQIKSPVNGKIGIINVTVGNYVTPTSGALTTINSTNPIYVTFPLDTKDFQSLVMTDGENAKNRKVELIMSNGQKYKYEGIQDFEDNKVDVTTGTVTLRATFDNPEGELINGDFVTVKLYANKPNNVPIVPLTSVMENQAGKYVYKIDTEGLPQLVYIKTAGQYKNNWIISEGLQTGDQIISEGLQKVIPGKPVKIVSSEEIKKIKTESNTEAKSNKKNKFFGKKQ